MKDRGRAGARRDAFGGVGMPTTVIIDAQGKVSEVVTGELSEEQLRGYISDMGVLDAPA